MRNEFAKEHRMPYSSAYAPTSPLPYRLLTLDWSTTCTLANVQLTAGLESWDKSES